MNVQSKEKIVDQQLLSSNKFFEKKVLDCMQTDGQANEAKHQLDKFGHTAIARRLIYYDRNFGTKIPVSDVRQGGTNKLVWLNPVLVWKLSKFIRGILALPSQHFR